MIASLLSTLVITVLGMGVVFSSLVTILVMIYIINALFPYQPQALEKEEEIDNEEEERKVAAITIAIRKYLGMKNVPNLKIKPE